MSLCLTLLVSGWYPWRILQLTWILRRLLPLLHQNYLSHDKNLRWLNLLHLDEWNVLGFDWKIENIIPTIPVGPSAAAHFASQASAPTILITWDKNSLKKLILSFFVEDGFFLDSLGFDLMLELKKEHQKWLVTGHDCL